MSAHFLTLSVPAFYCWRAGAVGDCLAGVLPVEGFAWGAGGHTLIRRAGQPCRCPCCCPAGLPQGSPRDARSREVAKKSPAAHQGAPPSLPAGWRGQVPAPGVGTPGGGGRHGTTFIPVPIAAGPERSFSGSHRQFPAANSRQPGAGSAAGQRERATGVRQQAGRSREILSPGEGGADDGGDHVDQSARVAVEGGAVVALPFDVAVVAEPHGAQPGPGRAGDLDVGGGLE